MKKASFLLLALIATMSIALPINARAYNRDYVAMTPTVAIEDAQSDYNGYILKFSDLPNLATLDDLALRHNVAVAPVIKSGITSGVFESIRSHCFVIHDTLVGATEKSQRDLENEIAGAYANIQIERNWNIHICSQKKFIPNDPYLQEQWNLKSIKAPQAWVHKRTAKGVIVAIVDSGINAAHPDLRPNVRDEYAYNVLDPENPTAFDNFHATFLAGLIGAAGNENVGMAGVAFECNMASIKFVTASGSGTVVNAITALAQCALLQEKTGKKVLINASWGLLNNSQLLEVAIRNLSQLKIPVVAAAGNYGVNFALYPAAYKLPNIIAVAAINSKNQLADFSEYDPTTVHLAAPGEYIFSTYPGGGYIILSGTSASAPLATAVLAMLMDDGNMSMEDAINCILTTVHPLDDLKHKVITGGTLDASAAFKKAFSKKTVSNT